MPIEIPELGDQRHQLWCDLMQMWRDFPGKWTIVGAHMVALHAWEAGLASRPSDDVDVLVNVRLAANGTKEISSYLVGKGYQPEVSRSQLAHLFTRGAARIDILAPEGIGVRASTATVHDRHTVRVPGGSQALARSSEIAVRSRQTEGLLPRPDLLGALLVKVRAIDVDDLPGSQRADVALLLQLIREPDALRAHLTRKERGWLKRHAYLASTDDPAWDTFAADDPALSAIVYRRLLGEDAKPAGNGTGQAG